MKVFGKLDRVIAGVVVSLAFLVVYGKLLSDFAQFYVTGHTTHLLWILGDIAGSQSSSPYSLVGFIWVMVLGYANMMIWLRLFRIAYKLAGRLYRFLAKYEIRRREKK